MRAFIYMLIGLMLLAPAFASAQTFQGGVRGAVRDADGGVLPGTTVTLTNIETGVTRTSVTNERGEYVFAAVAPGRYDLAVELAGFAPYRREALEIGVATQLVQDVTMQVGGIAESVTVTGETPLIETATASIASAIDKAQMEVLPTPGRNVFIMAVTTPNVVHAGDPVFVRMQDQTNASLLSLGGGPLRGNNYTLDGVSITDFINRAAINPSFEALEEMKVQISTYDSEMGRTAGGVFNSIHKSGSNNWAGSGLWQNRPSWGRSPTFFEDRAGQDPPETKYNLWGGSFGGPILRDKTFFWWAHEGYKQQDTRTNTVFTPSRAMANGNFSELGFPIYDPFTGQPFPGNVIPANRIDPAGASLAGFLADVGEACGGRECVATAILDNTAWQMSGNVNHSFTDSWQLTGTYMYYESEEPDNKYYTAIFGDTKVYDSGSAILLRDVNVIALNNTNIIGDSSVLTLRFGYARFNDSPNNPAFSSSDAAGLGWDADTMAQLNLQQFPYIDADGYGVGDHTHGSWNSSDRVHASTEFSGVFSQFVGAHTLKYGAQIRQYKIDWFRQGYLNFNFPQRFTSGPNGPGDGLATMLLGLPDSGSSELAVPNVSDVWYYGGFVQDDWRVNENLVLNLGVRIEHETGYGEQNNQMIWGWDYDNPYPIQAPGLNLTGGTLYAAVDGNPSRSGDMPGIKLGPRAGFSYSLDEGSVLRGGYALMWAPKNYVSPSVASHGNLGFSASTSYISFERGGQGTLSDPFPNGVNQPVGNALRRLTNVGQNVEFLDQFGQAPYVQQWSLDYQRDLGDNVAFKIGYVGSKSSKLPLGGTDDGQFNINQLDPAVAAQVGAGITQQLPNPMAGLGLGNDSATINRGQLLRPYPQYQNVRARQVTQGRATYASVRVEVEKRFRGTWGARVNYTWSSQKDNIFESVDRLSDEPDDIYVPSRIEDDFGLARISSPHWFNISGLYRLPGPDGGAAEAILGGWSASVTGIMRSGFPMVITQSENWGGAFGYDHMRPNRTGADPVTSGSTADRVDNFINPAAYAFTDDFQLGSSPHTDGAVRAPWLFNWDVSFEKMTSLGADANLSLRFELINFFNQPNWNGPRAVFGNANFGRITGQGGFPRVFQFMAKVTF